VLEVETRPPGARVTLSKFEDRGGRKVPGAPRDLGSTPLSAMAIEPGSYALDLEAPGRASVRQTFLVSRGERLAVRVDLPATSLVPKGFAYIPSGAFLFGSDEDEDVRRTFLGAPPQHLVRTDAFLIQRTEVTFEEWLAFLRSLAPAERARRLPKAGALLNGVELQEVAGGRWRLVFRAAGRSYTALDSEPMRYPGRSRRAVQRWQRFPVIGVSFEDALAYAAWLDRTGRVPGARLCDEREWERAARGADGRRYPNGDRLEPDDANIDVTYGRDPGGFGLDEVGSHPGSRSPFGVDDLAGNVWEWTRSATSSTEPVCRGGSWYQGDLTSRSANREVGVPTQREPFLGVRICATPRAPGPESGR
jgi:formylglycine-generating enzyme required for sulfatase activity